MTVQYVIPRQSSGEDLASLVAEGLTALLDRSIADYAQLLRSAAKPTRPEHLEALDHALRHTIVRLLVRPAERDELSEAYDGLRRLVPVEREGELAEWLPRWRAYADVLDARLASLGARDQERALQLLHAREIVDLVAREPGHTQAEICERLELKPANLSRILGVLEAHEFVERRTVGREKRVRLGRLGGEVVEPQAGTAGPRADDQTVEPMIHYLFRRESDSQAA